MKENIGVFVGILVWGTFLYWLVTRIAYVVDDQYLRVMLWRLTLRKVSISDIAFADTATPFWNEHWCNTAFVMKRIVRIRRKTGWIKNFIITPANREEFLRCLQSRLH